MQKQRPGIGRPTANSYVKANLERERQRERRLALILFGTFSIILPPVGLIASWRSNRIGTPARVLFSVAAFASMTLVFSLAMRANSVDTGILPVPRMPVQAGYSSGDMTPITAAVPVVIDTDPKIGSLTVNYGPDDAGLEEGGTLPVDPATQVTIVYAVTNNAVYYHYQQMCGMQNNSRRLVLEDAVAEGLLPCEKCVLTPDASE